MASRLAVFPVLWLCAAVVAQQDAPVGEAAPDPAFDGLVAAVRTAHRGDQVGRLTKFQAGLRMTPLRKTEDSLQVDLSATFLAPRFLRYKVDQASKSLEQGWDDRGPWARVDDEVENLGGREQAQARDAIRRQVTLARQLLDFLDPSTVLQALAKVQGPVRAPLRVGRNETVDCEVVAGVIERFPLFAPIDAETPEPRCRLRIWVDARTHRLRAVHAAPLGPGDRELGTGEFLLLTYDDQRRDGVAIPQTLVLYQGVPGAGGQPELSIAIRSIDLDPDGVTIETMREPR